jgi:hypothetical protein
MPIFCTSCGTLYGGWEFCPECNADNPIHKNSLVREFISAIEEIIVKPLYSDPAQEPVTYKVEGGVSSGENTAQDADKLKVHPYFSGC